MFKKCADWNLLDCHFSYFLENSHIFFIIQRQKYRKKWKFHAYKITNYVLKSLVLYECEKHPNEQEWCDDITLGDRLNGILLQLISCLQCRKSPHYFLPNVDLFKGKSVQSLDSAAKQCWRLTREMLINSHCLDRL